MWRESLHVVKPFKIPRGWVKFRAMDWGISRPYAVLWFAVDYDGDLYVYRELYGWGGKPNVGTGETARQVGEKITELEKASEDLRYGVLDSACWARTGVTGPTISEEINRVLVNKGLVPFTASSKGRLEGANAFKQRLIGNMLEDGSYKPAIKFFSTCIHCLRTIPMIGHDKHKPELPDTDSEDHCFVAGTLIHTLRGEIPIEEVTTADKVLTRRGYRKVLAAGMTKRNADVITVTFSNGKSLTGTANHPIFIEDKGFVPLDTVKYGDIIYPVSEVEKTCRENKQKQQNRSYLTELLSGVTRTQKTLRTGIITEQTGDFIIKALFTFIERFGSPIMAKFQSATKFTTKTETLLIMIFLILNYLQNMTIYRNMFWKILPIPTIMNVLKTIWLLSDPKRPNGTGQKKGESGTDSMELNAPRANHKDQKLSACVLNVEKNFTCDQKRLLAVSIALPHVVQNIVATTGLMTKQESVLCAARSLELIDTEEQKPAVKNAVPYIVDKCEEKRKADVYNLTVDEEHEYFANGFLVHNCYDACAYRCMSRPWVPIRKEQARRIEDAWRREEPKRSPWTY